MTILRLLIERINFVSISHIDHLVLTVNDIQTTLDFYVTVLGMTELTFGEGRKAVQFGNQKINLHRVGDEIQPHAQRPTSGSSDLCFITKRPLQEFIDHLIAHDIHIIEGPVQRTGATAKLNSVYFRDPDQNLIEVSTILKEK